jgi:hypothetical protein
MFRRAQPAERVGSCRRAGPLTPVASRSNHGIGSASPPAPLDRLTRPHPALPAEFAFEFWCEEQGAPWSRATHDPQTQLQLRRHATEL